MAKTNHLFYGTPETSGDGHSIGARKGTLLLVLDAGVRLRLWGFLLLLSWV